jgi:ABC-type cobalamin/Fe3+-siderophores transport system ATPase subunit
VSVLETRGLVCGYGARAVVDAGTMRLEAGESRSIVGLNGAGKSTLLRTICGQLGPLAGDVLVSGRSVASLEPRERARLVAFLPQQQEIDPGLTVEELVRLGRTPYLGRFGHLGPADAREVEGAMELCRVRELGRRRLGELSGGERQRARLAMVLAEKAPLVLLDEPASHLDVAQRFALHGVLAGMRADRGTAFLIVSHSIADAARFGDSLVLVRDGKADLLADASPGAVRAAMVAAAGIPEEWVY